MRTKIYPIKDILWFLAFLGLMSGIFRMWFGLGVTTNMVDSIPWGLWKILNMVAGAALATSGFTIGMLYYVFRIKLFKPLVVPSVVIAFLGYGSSLFSLLFDIGLPWRFWIPFVSWSPHSFLYEVFWCVSLYWAVTAFEFTPSLFDRFKSEKAARILHGMGFGAAVLGISLSSLHHSSLGSLFLVTPQRLFPLWYSSLLPLFFIISAMGAGMMFMLLLRILYAHFYDPEPVFGPMPKEGAITCSLDGTPVKATGSGKDMPMLETLAIIAVSILGVYLALKISDLFINGSWKYLTAGTWESWLYIFELLIGTVIPILLVALPKSRRSPTGLGIAALSASAGLVLNRLDVGIIGYFRDAGFVYFPSFSEWTLCLGIISATILVFLFFVENVSVFDENWKTRHVAKGIFSGSFDNLTHVLKSVLSETAQRVTLIAVISIPFAWIIQYPPYHESKNDATIVQPSIGLDALRKSLRIDGNRDGVFADFPHYEHQNRLGGEESCNNCHHLFLPGDKSTPCFRCHRNMLQSTLIFDHTLHVSAVADSEGFSGLHPENYTCKVCHTEGSVKTASNAKSCLECHNRDMGLADVKDSSLDISYATSYQRAMHGTCIKCHDLKAEELHKDQLNKCFICHKSLTPKDNLIDKMREPKLLLVENVRSESD
ncbi:MAG: cytochrome c3 family protein [Candidatus Electryonea clarkiae]|nr:cytochrome c3 family protein [Candidatus Electryonea clarkiae]